LHPLGVESVRDPLQEVGEAIRMAPGLLGGSFADAVVWDQLADRPDLDLDQARGRELRRRGELADRLDLITPVLQADRAARYPREHVEHAPADGELATVLHDIHTEVPELDELFGEPVR